MAQQSQQQCLALRLLPVMAPSWTLQPLHLGHGLLSTRSVKGDLGGDRTPLFADDSSSESCSGNGSSTLNPSTSSSTQGDSAFPEMNGNGTAAPMDFTASTDDQPINLCDKLTPAHVTPSYQSDSCSTDGLRSRVKYAVKTTAEVRGWGHGVGSEGTGVCVMLGLAWPRVPLPGLWREDGTSGMGMVAASQRERFELQLGEG